MIKAILTACGPAAVCCSLVSVAAALPPAYEIVDLGPTPSTTDGAYGVNEVGQVAGYQGVRAYRWEDGDFTWLSSTASQARDINNSGQIAGSINNQAVIWNGEVPTYLLPAITRRNHGMGINAAGDAVGYYDDGSIVHYRAFLWQQGVATTLVNPSGGGAYAYAVNSQRDVVGDANNAQGSPRGFRWRSGEMTMLPTLPGYDERSYARDVNDLGEVAAFAQRYVYDRAYIWHEGTVTELPHLPGSASSQSSAINNWGQVVGYSETAQGDRAVLWEGQTVYDLNDLVPSGSGWTLRYAYDISDTQWIVGVGRYAGADRAFLLLPEPSTLVLLSIGAVGLLGYAWRRRKGA